LPAAVIERLPVRYNYDNRYFSDRFQGIPRDGYGALLEKLTADAQIEVRLNCDFVPGAEWTEQFRGVPMVYTGPIDRYFGYRLGKLGWRTVDFEYEKLEDCADFQGCAVMNYADSEPKWTRILEFKHFHPEREVREASGRAKSVRTVIAREYSRAAGPEDEPYYPVDTGRDRDLLKQYQELARASAPEVFFAGRLGNYRYYDMDDTIAAALDLFESLRVRR
jgi:UDP-galactopyranose mutase